MKTFHVNVAFRTLETYQLEAEDEDDARDRWCEGRLVSTRDDILDTEVLSVRALPAPLPSTPTQED